jgi:hypothetical protein
MKETFLSSFVFIFVSFVDSLPIVVQLSTALLTLSYLAINVKTLFFPYAKNRIYRLTGKRRK